MPETIKHPIANLRRSGKRIVGVIALLLITGFFLGAQNSKPPQPRASAAPNSQIAPNTLPPLQLDGSAVLYHLNQVINWYRHFTTGIQTVGMPSDAIYQDNAKSLGSQVVRLAFDSAKAEASGIAAQQKNGGGNQPSAQTTQQQNLARLQANTSSKIDQLQSQIESLNSQIAKAPARRKDTLISQRDAFQGQLDLQKALLDVIQKMAAFVETNGEISGGLEGGINQLARSIPDVLGTSPNSPKKATTTTPAKPSLANSGGLISEATTLYSYLSTVRAIDGLIKETDYTRDVADHLRTPLRDALRATIQQSQKLANQPPATDPLQLQAEKQEFQQLTERFKQLSSAVLPLSQEIIVLNDSKTNFEEWRNSIAHESRHILSSVLLRVGAIVLALAVILVLSQIWRRITFRYVHDPRAGDGSFWSCAVW
jgi:TolA-binding protein